ncbi:GntR family transcriptional regulator [Billgrantia tianxiuensis]|jgi:DNA-binding GntR family transcriptional regulator|uniref:GntR family transcriptional regulator n=1 Tax=Billgrantia tianxiuensis TaxID=2497861 RepID=A0A6I6SJP7_9GAMM|nr:MULTISPECIES: GntR family transcriptional regulator [Halomonas]MCE8033067.1 GntR family transcriptional regulator [Halomonas sp. MCCC 1A11057]QHC48846.1 GntR family transcriptional regulator [Halomonas tianxiuensis]
MAETWTQEDLSPIRDKVYAYLKDAILRGEYKAGDRLVERVLAEKLNISRTPIREALFRLETQRFVRTVPRKGVVVNEITQAEILEVFMILASLESLAARLAAQKINDEIAAEIDRLMAEMDEALNDGGGDAVELNVKYNDLIGRASGNPKLHEMLVDLKDYVRAFSNLSAALPGRTKEALREHQDILGAIRGGEEDLAESFTRIHLEKSRKAYMSRSQV